MRAPCDAQTQRRTTTPPPALQLPRPQAQLPWPCRGLPVALRPNSGPWRCTRHWQLGLVEVAHSAARTAAVGGTRGRRWGHSAGRHLPSTARQHTHSSCQLWRRPRPRPQACPDAYSAGARAALAALASGWLCACSSIQCSGGCSIGRVQHPERLAASLPIGHTSGTVSCTFGTEGCMHVRVCCVCRLTRQDSSGRGERLDCYSSDSSQGRNTPPGAPSAGLTLPQVCMCVCWCASALCACVNVRVSVDHRKGCLRGSGGEGKGLAGGSGACAQPCIVLCASSFKQPPCLCHSSCNAQTHAMRCAVCHRRTLCDACHDAV